MEVEKIVAFWDAVKRVGLDRSKSAFLSFGESLVVYPVKRVSQVFPYFVSVVVRIVKIMRDFL